MGVSLSCIITVPGDGKGGYGKTKADRTGTVESFLVDNQVLYSAILKHLRKCQVCDPKEVLQKYLDRRLGNPKFKSQISRVLVAHSQKFRNVFKQRELPIPEDLIAEFMWRVGSPYGLTEYESKLSPEQIVRGLIYIKEEDRKTRSLIHNSVAALCEASIGCSVSIKQLAVIVDNMFTVDRPFPSKKELEDLMSVASVMLS